MSKNPFSHVDLRVKNMDQCLPFYNTLLPELGFKRKFHTEDWKVFAAQGDLPGISYFAITEDPEHRANSNRIAFWVENNTEVDRMAKIIADAGGLITEGPKLFPYSDTYYAVYFTDPSGNRLEILHRVT